MKKLITVIFLFCASSVFASELSIAERVQQCMNTLKPVEELMVHAGLTLEEDCKRRVNTDIEWEKSGKPILTLTAQGCSFLGVEGKSLSDCVPEKLSKNIRTVLIYVEPSVTAKTYAEATKLLRSKGVEDFMMEVKLDQL